MNFITSRPRILTQPFSPTEQRPPTTSTTAAPREPAVRVYQEPTFRRQQVPKPDPALHYSTLSSAVHDPSHSTGQVRQDSAIDQHRFEADDNVQLSKLNGSYSHQSPKHSERQPSPRPDTYHPASAASTYAPVHQSENLPSQTDAQLPARQHSRSVSSNGPYLAASPRSHEHSSERASVKNGVESRTNITGPSSLPEQFFTQQNNFGTRQQRYNVRFAANYTSETMSSSQKPRNDSPPSPSPSATVVATNTEHATSSPIPISTSEEEPVSTNGHTRSAESQPRPTRESRDRSDREPSVERCSGCNEAWRRPIPDMDQNLAPAETNADYMRLASNMIERLRAQNKKADAAYEDWKWRHSHCFRPASPHSIGSVDDTRRPDHIHKSDGTTTSQTAGKRKSEALHEPQVAPKQRKITEISPAPPVRKPE